MTRSQYRVLVWLLRPVDGRAAGSVPVGPGAPVKGDVEGLNDLDDANASLVDDGRSPSGDVWMRALAGDVPV